MKPELKFVADRVDTPLFSRHEVDADLLEEVCLDLLAPDAENMEQKRETAFHISTWISSLLQETDSLLLVFLALLGKMALSGLPFKPKEQRQWHEDMRFLVALCYRTMDMNRERARNDQS